MRGHDPLTVPRQGPDFRERLYDVLHEDAGVGPAAASSAVEHLLEMPEMQAINGAVFMAMTEQQFVRCRQWCDDYLPQTVRDWVVPLEPAS